ncbi:MAG TPA: hypothetical protein VMP68_26250 [Candidatus Eisenbacteria bacterium]|nr:hypothetical protein [Candidatus Eisenbacteria bacterium]
MGPIDPEASVELQSELVSGENLLWAGRPNRSVIFHSEDGLAIPFSLLWGGFAIFWEAIALGLWPHNSKGPAFFMVIPGIPFVLIGQYLIWGRFLYDGWLKRRTYYGITNRRLIVLQEATRRKSCSLFLNAIPTVERDGAFTGTIWFGSKYTTTKGQRAQSWSRFSVRDVPVFADLDDAESIYRLILDLSGKARTRPDEAVGAFHSSN